MKQTKFRILRIFTALGAVVLLLGLATPNLRAEFECKQELMAGAWVAYGNISGQGNFPPGPWSAVGLVVFDEKGVATTAIQTNTTSLTPNGTFGGKALGDDFLTRQIVRLTINPDCTGRYTWHEARSGHPFEGALVFRLDVVCGNAQRECYATFTDTPPPGNTDPVKSSATGC